MHDLSAAVSPSIPAAQGQVLPIELTRRCLFVIGPAKSGTTILLEALNSSRDIYLLNEPDFHADPGTLGFAARFNAHYAQWATQPTKGRYCPDFFDGGGRWTDSLERLGRSYALVGAKIITRPAPPTDALRELLRFHTREFFDSHYVFIFRSPVEIARSSYHFQRAFGTYPSPIDHVLRNFVDTIEMFITMRRLFPRVHIVFHHSMCSETFAGLGTALNVDLPDAASYYEGARVLDHAPLSLSSDHQRTITLATELFDELLALSAANFPQIQLGQGNLVTDPALYTRVGRLSQRCDQVSKTWGMRGSTEP